MVESLSEKKIDRVKEFHIIVAIKPIKGNTFLKSTLVTATICSFLGYTDDVFPVMKNLCHSSRTCIITTNGLTGFLVKLTAEMILDKLHEEGKLKEKTGLTPGVYYILKG